MVGIRPQKLGRKPMQMLPFPSSKVRSVSDIQNTCVFKRFLRFFIQAMAAWQWYNYAEAHVPAGKDVLRLNLDETSICLFQGNDKGNVLLSKKRPAEHGPMQRVSRARRRTCLTHVAFLCDQPEIQPLLPQVLIGNEATFQVRAMARLQSARPTNVRLVRQKSSWNNQQLCAIIIRMLAHALRPYKDRFQPVLLLDACRLHFAQIVLNACNNCGIWVVLVPAKTTWLLQPLDTDVFRSFKSVLRRAYQKARVEAGTHDLSIEQFLPCVYEAIRRILQGMPWASAFTKNGFGNRQANVADNIKRELEVAGPLQASAARPSWEQLESVFPKRTTVPAASLLRPFFVVPMPKCASKASGLHAAAKSVPMSDAAVRFGRTRSEHKRAAVARAVVASSSSSAAIAVPHIFAVGHRLPRPTAKAVVEGR